MVGTNWATIASPPAINARYQESAETRVVNEVLTVLGMIGPDAKEAIPALERMMEAADKQLALRAKAALRQIRGRAP